MRALLVMGAILGLGFYYQKDDYNSAVPAILVVIYFLPTFVAWGRRHPGTLMVFVINLFLGWTFLGWVSAIIQACVPIYSSIPISVTDHRNTGGFAG